MRMSGVRRAKGKLYDEEGYDGLDACICMEIGYRARTLLHAVFKTVSMRATHGIMSAHGHASPFYPITGRVALPPQDAISRIPTKAVAESSQRWSTAWRHGLSVSTFEALPARTVFFSQRASVAGQYSHAGGVSANRNPPCHSLSQPSFTHQQ